MTEGAQTPSVSRQVMLPKGVFKYVYNTKFTGALATYPYTTDVKIDG
jgi:hypothetical protein